MIPHIYKAVVQQSVVLAWTTMRENVLRTLMSVIGVAIGVAAILLVGAITKNGREHVFAELETYGMHTLWVFRKYAENPLMQQRQGTGIRNADYNALIEVCCDHAQRFSPVVYASDWRVKLKSGYAYATGNMEGVGVEYLNINNDRLQEGRNFKSDEINGRRPVMIIGPKLRDKLFPGRPQVVGEHVRMNNRRFTIIGVLKEKKRALLDAMGLTQDYNVNERALMPYKLYQHILGSQDIQDILVEASSLQQADSVINDVIAFLVRRTHGQYQYKGESMKGWIGTANEILAEINRLGWFAGAIALVVGAVGIFNVMASSVIERTREIGLRKAVGASRSDILGQFLVESSTIGLIGGLLGFVVAVLSMLIISLVSGYSLQIGLLSTLMAIAVALVVGALAGYFPAKRAADMRPMDALRYE